MALTPGFKNVLKLAAIVLVVGGGGYTAYTKKPEWFNPTKAPVVVEAPTPAEAPPAPVAATPAPADVSPASLPPPNGNEALDKLRGINFK